MKKTITKLSGAASAAVTALGLLPAMVYAQSVSITSTPVEPQRGFAKDFGSLLNSVLTIVMVIAALLVFFYLILGGIEWITSGGEKGKTEAARNKITAAVVGLIILAASYAVVTLILRFLGFADVQDALKVRPIN
jgi:hypothetical protein